MTSNSKIRQIFSDQPARHLLLDIGSPMNCQTLQHVTLAVENVLALACASRGAEKIPFFGMSLIDSQFQPLLKITPLKGNFKKISKELRDISNSASVFRRLAPDSFNDYVHTAINTALNDFDLLPLNTDTPSSIEITLVTGKDGVPLRNYIQGLLGKLNSAKLRKILVVEIGDTVEETSEDRTETVGLVKVSGRSESVGTVLKEWLEESRRSGREEDVVVRVAGLRMRCEARGSLLDPGALPYGQRFFLRTDLLPSASHHGHTPDSELPIYELEVVNRLSNSGLCESFVFGQPVHITASKHGGEGQAEEELNQQIFCALCKSLTESEEYLLAKLVSVEPPNGFFVLMPGPAMLLAKSVASSELLCPPQETTSFTDLPPSVHLMVNNALKSVPCENEYRPEHFESGLCRVIVSHLLSMKNKCNRKVEKNFGLDEGGFGSGTPDFRVGGPSSSSRENLLTKVKKQLRKRRAEENIDLLKYFTPAPK